MAEDRGWREYEKQIYDRLVKAAGGDDEATVTFDARLPGRFSKVDRQIDAYVEGRFADCVARGTMAVDCKCFSRRVDVKDVETFIGLVEDVGTDFGLLVTTEGFTPAAEARAKAHRGVYVEIVPYEELEEWEPDVEFCQVCTDPESDRAPGPVYLDPIDPGVPGAEHARGMGRCWSCNTMHMRCVCGGLNSLYENEEGAWVECSAGCGVEWKVEVELDRKGMEEGETVEFRRAI
jgi:restriction endonuclease